MQYKGPIRAVNLLIRDFIDNSKSCCQESRSARLAKTKLAAKFEESTSRHSAERRSAAWQRWIDFDAGLPRGGLLGPHWAKARLIVHDALKNFHLGALTFTNGSSFEPLGDKTSIACKLSGTWTITDDCFELFANYSYWHRALKHSVKKRFTSYCTQHGLREKDMNNKLWTRFSKTKRPGFEVYKFKLFCVTTIVGGNRWSSVPKNNLKDRPICLEPLCNMLVQRAIGLGVRKCLKDAFGIDLDVLADMHKRRISDRNVATIDLSDCSDAISMRLVKYLLPYKIFDKISSSRSFLTLGPDGDYYIPYKVSSMGNGFTFDLMTLILMALTRVFDQTSSVFGDDIICQNQYANDIIETLQIAGFVINKEKSFVNSDYRESCGSHYIDGYGYVTVFDLRWITEPHELIVACNKVSILSSIYGEPFESLRAAIWACVPRPLLGATVDRPAEHMGRPPSYELDTYIRYGPTVQVDPKRNVLKLIRRSCSNYQKSGRISVALAFVTTQLPARTSLDSCHWDRYYQYLHDVRKTRKFKRLVNKSTLVARVDKEQIGLVVSLLPVRE